MPFTKAWRCGMIISHPALQPLRDWQSGRRAPSPQAGFWTPKLKRSSDCRCWRPMRWRAGCWRRWRRWRTCAWMCPIPQTWWPRLCRAPSWTTCCRPPLWTASLLVRVVLFGSNGSCIETVNVILRTVHPKHMYPCAHLHVGHAGVCVDVSSKGIGLVQRLVFALCQ